MEIDIDKAILCEKKSQNMHLEKSNTYPKDSGWYSYHINLAEYHSKIALWLEELKELRKFTTK